MRQRHRDLTYLELCSTSFRAVFDQSGIFAGIMDLLWRETGVPKVQEPTRKGFGGQVIEQIIAPHSGKARFDWRVEGLVCELTLKRAQTCGVSAIAARAMRNVR